MSRAVRKKKGGGVPVTNGAANGKGLDVNAWVISFSEQIAQLREYESAANEYRKALTDSLALQSEWNANVSAEMKVMNIKIWAILIILVVQGFFLMLLSPPFQKFVEYMGWVL